MKDMLSIQSFSARTGIPKSALRFYETKNLLIPAFRDQNGYRFYHREQIQLAKLISSLRLAQIPIKEIQAYLTLGSQEREDKMSLWISELKKMHQVMGASLHYLESYQSSSEIYFFDKSACEVIWFEAEAQPGKFSTVFQEKLSMLRMLEIQVDEAYLQYMSGEDRIKARVGFRINSEGEKEKLIHAGRCESMPAMVCIGMPFRLELSSIKSGYKQLFDYAQQHNWLPAGAILEWYRGGNLEDLDLIMPIIKGDF